MPPQVRALRALLVLQHSRRDARLHDGRLVVLAEHASIERSPSPSHDAAIELCQNEVERAHIRSRRAELVRR